MPLYIYLYYIYLVTFNQRQPSLKALNDLPRVTLNQLGLLRVTSDQCRVTFNQYEGGLGDIRPTQGDNKPMLKASRVTLNQHRVTLDQRRVIFNQHRQ